MATQQRTIEYRLEQAHGAGAVAAKPMLGEFLRITVAELPAPKPKKAKHIR